MTKTLGKVVVILKVLRPAKITVDNSDFICKVIVIRLRAEGRDNLMPRVIRKNVRANFVTLTITSSRSRVVNRCIRFCLIEITGHLGITRVIGIGLIRSERSDFDNFGHNSTPLVN